MSVFQLIPGVQSYEWGVPGGDKDSIVADLAEATPELGLQREASKPYAELWMGTHPTLPSHVLGENHELLNDRLCKDHSLLGEKVVGKYGASEKGALPFLFKVLSIAKALSIQAHPDKKLAERLHAEKPNMYKDDNHKPEMAIAIRAFEGFCGFRPVREVLEFVEAVPELKQVLKADDTLRTQLKSAADAQDVLWAGQASDDAQSRVHDALRAAFGALMRADASLYEPLVSSIAQRYRAARSAHTPLEVSDEVAELVARLDTQFPRDIGVFCTFFLNIVHLVPGQALFLGADEPHAYLSGHILECMAASDNVVRAGLTPKARDVEVLVDMLTYQSARAKDQILHAPQWDGDAAKPNATCLYDPPIEEFSVLVTTLVPGSQTSSQRAIDGPSLVLVVEGKGTLKVDGQAHELYAGLVLFVGAATPIELETSESVTVARAFIEVA